MNRTQPSRTAVALTTPAVRFRLRTSTPPAGGLRLHVPGHVQPHAGYPLALLQLPGRRISFVVTLV